MLLCYNYVHLSNSYVYNIGILLGFFFFPFTGFVPFVQHHQTTEMNDFKKKILLFLDIYKV